MKKIYINPEMKVVKILATKQMLAASGPAVSGSTYNPNEDGEFIGGRGFDFDDEE